MYVGSQSHVIMMSCYSYIDNESPDVLLAILSTLHSVQKVKAAARPFHLGNSERPLYEHCLNLVWNKSQHLISRRILDR